MSSQFKRGEASTCEGIGHVEKHELEVEGLTSPTSSEKLCSCSEAERLSHLDLKLTKAAQEATPTSDQADMTVNTSSSEGSASTPTSESSVSAGEDDTTDEDERSDVEDGDSEEIDGESSDDEDSHDEQSTDVDDGSSGDDSEDGLKNSIAAKQPAVAIHECSGHKHAKQRIVRLPDGRELFSVLLGVHFNDTLIDHSRTYASPSSMTDDIEISARPELQDLEQLQALLEVQFTDLMAGIDPRERHMSKRSRRSLLRYTVKLEFRVGQDRAANIPLQEFMNFGTVPIPGEEALELIAKMDEIVTNAIGFVDDIVAGKDIARYKLENGLSGVESQAILEGHVEAIESCEHRKEENLGAASNGGQICYLHSGDGRPLFSVVFNIHFREIQQSDSRTFVSAVEKTKDHNLSVGLCDLDFKHLQRLVQISLNNEIESSGLFNTEKDSIADERREQARCFIELQFLTGPGRNARKEYAVHAESPISPSAATRIKKDFEHCISDAVKTIDAIAAERQAACHEPGYDPCSFISDFQARRAVGKDKRHEMEKDRLRQMAADAHAQLRKHTLAVSDGAGVSDCCSDDARKVSDGQGHEHAPSNTPNSSCCCGE